MPPKQYCRYAGHNHNPEHLKRCYICYSAAEEEKAASQRQRRSRSPAPSTSHQSKIKSQDSKEKVPTPAKSSSLSAASAHPEKPPSTPEHPSTPESLETFKKPRSRSESAVDLRAKKPFSISETSSSSSSQKHPIGPKSTLETVKSDSRPESPIETKKCPSKAESSTESAKKAPSRAQSPAESARNPSKVESAESTKKPSNRAETPTESAKKPSIRAETPAESAKKPPKTETPAESAKKPSGAESLTETVKKHSCVEKKLPTKVQGPIVTPTKVQGPIVTPTKVQGSTVTAELTKRSQAKAKPSIELTARKSDSEDSEIKSPVIKSSLPQEQSQFSEPIVHGEDWKGETPVRPIYFSVPRVALATSTPINLMSTAKSQPIQAKPPVVQAPFVTPEKPPPTTAASYPSAHIPKISKIPLPHQIMATTGGPLTRSQAQHVGALDGHHSQVSASSVEERTLDQCFRISPKWHYIKSSHEETTSWLDTAGYEAILLELLYFAHDQGHIQHKEMEGQFEKELERAMSSIEKLDCLDAFCKTFIRENRFRPAGKLTLSGSGKDDKYNRLFRMINSDLQNLQRQHRILSMVCSGTADHEVHTQAQRENLRKLVEDLVSIVHPGDRGTYSEVYKVIAESAVYDQHMIKPQLTSLKLVCHPDITVPFGGPIMAGGAAIRCDTLEQKIRAKLPSLLIKMHFSDYTTDRKWPDLSHGEDSGNASTLDGLDESAGSTPTGTGRGKGKDDKPTTKTGPATTPSSANRSGKRKHPDEPTPASKRHREDLHSTGYESQPGDAQVINEIYGEHVAQLICSLSQAPLGYVKHCKYSVMANDERDGTASVTGLGLIVSGENIYLTKVDASDDYLDSLVETFRMDQINFSCLANPLNLYKGTHLKALLMFLRYVCLNFPRTTYFLSD